MKANELTDPKDKRAIAWQPIETAPKDGTEIVGAQEWAPGKWCHAIMRWDGDGWDDYESFSRPKPTLWMPIPPHE